MTDQTQPFLCRLAADLPTFRDGFDELPAEIQWMPPGKHTITAMRDGKPETITLLVDAIGAERINNLLADRRSQAAAGAGDIPYFDLNHADGEAAGRPTAFRWAGDDPVTGGIRAAVEWTGPGKSALAGKAFRRFSPSFFVDAEGRVLGAPINMGGLVNRAAFKTIAPIVSKDGGGSQSQTQESSMNEQELAALKAAVTAKDAEIAGLQAQVANLQTLIATHAKATATAIVDVAIKAGKLPPQATELHGKWIDAIAATPALAETLNAIPPNAALATVITAGSHADPSKAISGKFEDLVQAEISTKKISKSAAIDAIMASNPAAYTAWRAKGGLL